MSMASDISLPPLRETLLSDNIIKLPHQDFKWMECIFGNLFGYTGLAYSVGVKKK